MYGSTFILEQEYADQKMFQYTFGDKKVGCQGIFFFENEDEGNEFAEDVGKYLKSLRDNTTEHFKIYDKWKADRMLKNYLIEIKHRVEREKEDPLIWYDRGVFYQKSW